MAKTLKFALSALALVNGHKPRDDLQHAYDQFLKDFGKSYDSVEKQAGCHGPVIKPKLKFFQQLLEEGHRTDVPSTPSSQHRG